MSLYATAMTYGENNAICQENIVSQKVIENHVNL